MLRLFFYTCAAYAALPIFCAVMLWRGLRGHRSYWRDFSQRFGYGPAPSGPCIWIHAVSFGEVQAAAALVFALQRTYPEVPLLVTTGTPTGTDRAVALFKDRVCVRYAPYDIPISVRHFFDRVKPRVGIIFETELWPNLYDECRRRRVPLVLASARISPKSAMRYRWLSGLFRQTLSCGVIVAAQGPGDAERFRAMGADPALTHVTGNIKFDFALPPDTEDKGRAIRALHSPRRPVWTAGSTHSGEEEIVIEAHRLVRKTHSDALLFLVPRHARRFDEVAEWLESKKVRFVRHSRGEVCAPDTEVLLVDSLGELLAFYAASDVSFVGGSLAPVGGHNLLEPAALAMPVLTGPHHFNGEDLLQLLLRRGAVKLVRTANDLGDEVAALLSDPAGRTRMGALGRAAVDENRGALEKLLKLLAPLIESRTRD